MNLADHGKSAVLYYRSRGADANSIIADPLFRDVKNGDFRLNENSPAYQLGFKDIDMRRIGITSEYPTKFKDIVKGQLGADFDQFSKLEILCLPKIGTTEKELKEADGI